MNESNTDCSPVGYDGNWYISEGWAGEYPNQFSITKKDVVLYGRQAMRRSSAQIVHCPMPLHATYSPWNAVRKQKDQLRFFTASTIQTLTVKETTQVETESWLGEDTILLELIEGETLEYLTARGKDLGLYRYQNKHYLISNERVNNVVHPADMPNYTELWINLPATNGRRAWVLFDEAIDVDGIEETTPESVGVAYDLGITPARPQPNRFYPPKLTLVQTIPTAA